MVASAIGGSAAASVIGGAVNAGSSSKAASIQAQQAAASARALGQAGEAGQNYLNPYVAAGNNELSDITSNNALWGNINNGFTDQAEGSVNQANGILNKLATGGITAQTIQDLPGYSAIQQLGQQGVTNSAAARGLANSGAALKGAADYATTQAQAGYQNLYNDQIGTANALMNAGTGFDEVNQANQGNITNTFNRENALAGYGFQAAGLSDQNALAAAGASNAYASSGANALASGVLGGANALTGGLSNATGTAATYLMYQRMLGGGGSSGGSGTAGNSAYTASVADLPVGELQ